MAQNRQQKAEQIGELRAELEQATSAIIGTFAKLTVSQDFALRKTVRSVGRYRVLKNTLASRAAKGTRIEAALQELEGVSSVAYTSGDPVALAKALSTWAQDNAEFTFKFGIIDGKVISASEIRILAAIPGKDELLAKLLFLINSPAQRLVIVLNAAVQQNSFRNTEKTMTNLHQLEEEIAGLSLIDAAALVAKLEERLGVSAAARMMSAIGTGNTEEAEVPEQTEFTVILKDVGMNKINTIKAVREVTSLGLKEAKDLVDGAPMTLKENISKDDAEAIKKKFDGIATIEVN